MTNQFKFGDRVRDTALGLGECVVINTSENSVYIINERGDYDAVAQPETLEIIPHHDTARLEFIAAECDSTLDELRDVLDTVRQICPLGTRMP